MARNKKGSPKEREAHLVRVWELYQQGKYMSVIATELGVSRQQISYDLGVLEKRWREANLESVNEAKLKDLAKIDRMENEYWDAWERSVGFHKKETHTETTGEHGGLTEKVESEELVGDPQFLRGVEWCVEQRAKILGYYAPVKQDIKVETDFSKLSQAELEAQAVAILKQRGAISDNAGATTPGAVSEVAG